MLQEGRLQRQDDGRYDEIRAEGGGREKLG